MKPADKEKLLKDKKEDSKKQKKLSEITNIRKRSFCFWKIFRQASFLIRGDERRT